MNAERIDVCICTYRRSSLRKTLASIATQDLPTNISVRVVVADNDILPTRRKDILEAGHALGLDLIYLHAPSNNISVARNACLDAARSDWIAFIDDDEVAAPDWIGKLLAARYDVEVVFGISQARYIDKRCADWIIEGDFHSNRLQGNDADWNGYTANVLIDRIWIARYDLRFAQELGQVGGEDTMFFYMIHRVGGRFTYAPAAVVFEDTSAQRASLSWLIKRRYRSGQIHHMILQLEGRNRGQSLALALVKSIYSLAAAGLNFLSPVRRVEGLLRAAMHIGVMSGALGVSPYREYGDGKG